LLFYRGFSRGATGFHRGAKPVGVNYLAENIPLNGQTRQEK